MLLRPVDATFLKTGWWNTNEWHLSPCRQRYTVKFSILLPLRAVYFRSFLYETPCTNRPTIPHTTSKIILPHFVNKDWSEKLISSLNWSCGTALGLLPSTIDRNPMPKAKSFNFSAKNLIGFSHFFRIYFFILFHSFFFVLEVFTDRLLNYSIHCLTYKFQNRVEI